MANSNLSKLSVVESKWFKRKNTSVKGLFDLIADLHCENPNEYHYEMAMSEEALKEAVPRLGSDNQVRWLYIATHGDADGLHLANGDVFSRTKLRNLFRQIKDTPGSKLHGLFLGSCLFGDEALADFLLGPDVDLAWVAGYGEEVDWIESSTLDFLFFNTLLKYRDVEKTERQLIEAVASELVDRVPGLILDLGFGIHVRKRGGGIENLVEIELEDDEG